MDLSWVYTKSNNNKWILLVFIISLVLFIFNMNMFQKKTDKFNDTPATPTVKRTYPYVTRSASDIADFVPYGTNYRTYYGKISDDINDVFNPKNPNNPNYKISQEEINKRNYWAGLDSDEGSLSNTNGGRQFGYNDILQVNSDLYTSNSASNEASKVLAGNYSTIGDYATLDSLGKGLTDQLGGISTGMGFTLLDEQLGTFKPYEYSSPSAYDNTANYKSGINPNTVDGVTGTGFSGSFKQDNRPIFLQKDFEGVANIFAPNIIIANPPLNSDGTPDISYQF